MSKQSIIAITFSLFLIGALAQNTTKIVTPSAATGTAQSQSVAADDAVKKAQDAVKTANARVAANQTALGTALGDMNTANNLMTQLVSAGTAARLALSQAQAKAAAALSMKAAATLSYNVVNAGATCAAGLNTWATNANKLVSKVGSTTTDINVAGGTYLPARTALVGNTFSTLLSTLNARLVNLKAKIETAQGIARGVVKSGCKPSVWTDFKAAWDMTKVTGGKCIDLTVGGFAGLKTKCNDGTKTQTAADVCKFEDFKTWFGKMSTLMTTVAPAFYATQGEKAAYKQIKDWIAKDANKLVATYTSDVEGKLATSITALKNLMTAYSAQTLILKNGLAAAVSAVDAAVTADGDGTTAGNIKTAAAKVVSDGSALTTAKGKVTAAMATTGDWGKAKAAVKTARDTVTSQRTALGGLVAKQWAAAVVLQNAQVVNSVATQVDADAKTASSYADSILKKWQDNDKTVAAALKTWQDAADKQKNATNYKINPNFGKKKKLF